MGTPNRPAAPVVLKNLTDGSLKEYPADAVPALLASKKYVQPGERDALAGNLAKATAAEGEAKYGGAEGAIDAFATAGLRAGSGGIVDINNPAEAYHPYVSAAGTVAGIAADPFGEFAAISSAASKIGVKAAGALKAGKAVETGVRVAADVALGDAAFAGAQVLNGDRSFSDALVGSVYNKGALGIGLLGATLTRGKLRKLDAAAKARGLAEANAGRTAAAEGVAGALDNATAEVAARQATLAEKQAALEAAKAAPVSTVDPDLWHQTHTAVNDEARRVKVLINPDEPAKRVANLERQAATAPERTREWERGSAEWDASEAARVAGKGRESAAAAEAKYATDLKAARDDAFTRFIEGERKAYTPAVASELRVESANDAHLAAVRRQQVNDITKARDAEYRRFLKIDRAKSTDALIAESQAGGVKLSKTKAKEAYAASFDKASLDPQFEQWLIKEKKPHLGAKEVERRIAEIGNNRKLTAGAATTAAKGRFSDYLASNPKEVEAKFEQWLVDNHMGSLTREGQAQGHLADHYMRRISELGDDIPTTPEEYNRLFDNIAAEGGHVPNGRTPKRPPSMTLAEDNQYRGFLPETDLRPLTADEATRTYSIRTQVGSAENRVLEFSADEARQLSTGRQVQIVEKLGLSSAEAQTFLKTLSPTSRFAVMGQLTGRIAYGEATTLQKHLLETGPYSERAARTRFELAESLPQSFVPDGNAVPRPSLDIAPPYRSNAPENAMLPDAPRPYPVPRPRTDFASDIKSLQDDVDQLRTAKTAAEKIKLPTSVAGFLKMPDAAVDEIAMATAVAKKSNHRELANLGNVVENKVKKLLDNAGIDTAETEDVFGALKAYRQTFKEARATRGTAIGQASKAVAAAKAEAAAAERAAKAAAKAGPAAFKAADAANLAAAQELGLVTTRNGRLSPGKEAVVIGARRIGSKIGMAAGSVLGPLGKIGGFAFGGSKLASKADDLMRGGRKEVERALSHEALIAVAERRERMAKAYVGVLKLATQASFQRVQKPLGSLFRNDKDLLLDLFPEDSRPDANASDDAILQRLGEALASASMDPASHAYEAVKPFIATQPAFAEASAQSLQARHEALSKVMPDRPYFGYVSRTVIPMSASQITKAKRGIDAIVNSDRVLAGMIERGEFPAEELNLIRHTNPALVQEAVMEVSKRLFTPGEDGQAPFAKLSRNQRRQFSQFFGQEMDPSDSPRYIAAMQAMSADAKTPKENASQQLRGPRGKPIAPAEDTESQRSTYR
mgnify:CR=1 FL=1